MDEQNKNPELNAVEVPPEQPIPTPGPAGGSGGTTSGAPDLPIASQGGSAIQQPPELTAAVERAALEDAEADIQAPEKTSVWTKFISPIVALVAICIVTSLALSLTNSVTAPMIEANAAGAADLARQEVLPDADSFEEMDVDAENVAAMYVATNGAGYVIECSGPGGYAGKVPAMVAFNNEGTIVGVKFLENGETPGLGKNLETDTTFSGQFTDLPPENITIDNIDTLANSTISSKAALAAVNAAIDAFNQQVGASGGKEGA